HQDRPEARPSGPEGRRQRQDQRFREHAIRFHLLGRVRPLSQAAPVARRKRDRLAAVHASTMGLLLRPIPARSRTADQAQAERDLQRTCVRHVPRGLCGHALLPLVGREELHVVERLSALQHDVPPFTAGRRVSPRWLVGGEAESPDARQRHPTIRPRPLISAARRRQVGRRNKGAPGGTMFRAALPALAASVIAMASAGAETVADFYRNKTIDVYIGFSVGGVYDINARVLSRFMGRHIPGNPILIPRQMTGAASLTL